MSTAARQALERLFVNLREAGVTAHLAEVKGPVLDILERVGLPEKIAPGRIFFSTNETIEALLAKRETVTG